MAGRVLDVTSHTTLEFVDAAIEGGDFATDGAGVVDVHTPKDDPDAVVLEFEIDPTSTGRVEPHADRITLTEGQARDLADALREAIEEDGSDRPRRLKG